MKCGNDIHRDNILVVVNSSCVESRVARRYNTMKGSVSQRRAPHVKYFYTSQYNYPWRLAEKGVDYGVGREMSFG